MGEILCQVYLRQLAPNSTNLKGFFSLLLYPHLKHTYEKYFAACSRSFISRNNVMCWKGTVLNLFLDCQDSPGGHFTVRRQEGKSLCCEEKTEQRLYTRIYFHVILFLHYYRSHLAGPSYSFSSKTP